ncbi:MAG TPA: PQQ-binding-like beta-propeller repeat protein [Candidatus Polarisedimenticolaceae bacterium]|nr:PQQ-binding-like beta-propeller repeat protein [Candidatus Polarisedimenticolaceae bacterium]
MLHRWLTALGTLLLAAVAAADSGEALREAAARGDLAAVRAQLEAGIPADAADEHGLTALIRAAQKGRSDVVRLLVERGADVSARESFFGATPLESALEGGFVEIAKFLLERGAEPSSAALAEAVEHEDIELARAALATGRIEPLELAAARRAAEMKTSAALKELLAAAKLEPRPRAPFTLATARLPAYAGHFKAESTDAEVALREGKLGLSIGRAPEVNLRPVARDRFENEEGTLAVDFGGRAGLIEWMRVNRGGEVTRFNAVTADPTPMRQEETAALEPAPREAARPWPSFRGADASGNGDGQGAPATWDVKSGRNIRFKTPVPGIALSSPAIWGERIFLTTAVSSAGDSTFRTGLYGDGTSVDDSSEHVFRVLALDAKTGRVLWDREAQRGKPGVQRHLKSSQANASPATDGKRVVALFGSVGALVAYDLDGTLLWKRDVGVLDASDPIHNAAQWGHASSPILYKDLVIVQGDRPKDSFLAAYALATGEPVWRVARDEPSTWATPNVLRGTGGDEIVTNGQTIRGYEPATGKLLWTLGPNSEVVVATPVVTPGMAFITAGYPPVRPVYALRAGQRGDLRLPEGKTSSAAIAWSHERGGTYLPTPILYRGFLYTCNNNGILTCYRADSGEQVYQTRLGGGGASFSASPIAADGRLYFTAETGEVYVLRAGAEYALLATNALDEVVMATPAISDGLLVVRTLGQVVGIAAGSPASAAAR